MKQSDKNKVKKAIKLMQQAEELIQQVAKNDKAYRNSCNSIYRTNRLDQAIRCITTDFMDFE